MDELIKDAFEDTDGADGVILGKDDGLKVRVKGLEFNLAMLPTFVRDGFFAIVPFDSIATTVGIVIFAALGEDYLAIT